MARDRVPWERFGVNRIVACAVGAALRAAPVAAHPVSLAEPVVDAVDQLDRDLDFRDVSFGIFGGMLALVPPSGSRAYGPLVGISLYRFADHGVKLVYGGDVELGYAGSAVQGESRTGVGVSVGALGMSIRALGGVTVGSIGPADAFSGYVELAGRFDLDAAVVSAGWVHSTSEFGGHDRIDLRISGLAKTYLLGAQLDVFSADPGNPMSVGGKTLVTYIGIGN